LILVVVAGAELFTGNNLLVMAWAGKRITTGELLQNWLIVYLANFVGAIGLACLVYFSGHWQMNDGAVGANMVKVAAVKAAIPFGKPSSREYCATSWSVSRCGSPWPDAA
jgi:formate/nitrite transporter FocA (FNT family)